jgi:hypothetical protein
MATVASLLVFCVAALCTPMGAGEKKASMKLMLAYVEVKETNTDGKAWDINNGKPDLFVRIKNLSDSSIKEWTSKTMDDTFKATFNVPVFNVVEGQELEIEVLDSDVTVNDSAGKTKYTLTKERMKEGHVILTFSQVTGLRLDFKNP